MSHTTQNLWTVYKIINRNIILKQNVWVPIEFLPSVLLTSEALFQQPLSLKKKLKTCQKRNIKKKSELGIFNANNANDV